MWLPWGKVLVQAPVPCLGHRGGVSIGRASGVSSGRTMGCGIGQWAVTQTVLAELKYGGRLCIAIDQLGLAVGAAR